MCTYLCGVKMMDEKLRMESATRDVRMLTRLRQNSHDPAPANSRLPSLDRQRSDEVDPVDDDVPLEVAMRKQTLYRWFKNKLWCIRRSASQESQSERYRPRASSGAAKRSETSRLQKGKYNKSKSKVKALPERKSTNLLSRRTSAVKKVPLTDQPAKAVDPDERQVTFNEIVRTHIKTKYVTADEMKQIKSMNPHHIMYQLIALKNQELTANRATMPCKNKRTRKKPANPPFASTSKRVKAKSILLSGRTPRVSARRFEFGKVAREAKFDGEHLGQLPKISTLDVYPGSVSFLPWRKTLPDKKQKYQLVVGRLFDILRILGRAPFYRNEEGAMEFKFVSMIAVYSLTAYLSIAYLSYLFLRDGIGLFSKVDFNGKMELLFTMSLILSQVIAPVDSWIRVRSTQRYLNSWNEFQTRYEEVTVQTFPPIPLLQPSYRIMVACSVIWTTVFIVLFPYCLANVLPQMHLPIFILSALGNAIHFGVWVVTAHVIGKVSQEFYENFRGEILKSDGYTSKVEQYRLLWMQLSRLVHDCGSSNGICVTIFILQTTFSFVLFIHMAIFNIPKHLVDHAYYRIPIDVFVAWFWYLVLRAYCEAGHKMTESCTSYPLENILRLKKYNFLQEELHLNILFFTLKHYRAMASVSNYYVVNRALFGSICTSVITYIIVLIQFHFSRNL